MIFLINWRHHSLSGKKLTLVTLFISSPSPIWRSASKNHPLRSSTNQKWDTCDTGRWSNIAEVCNKWLPADHPFFCHILLQFKKTKPTTDSQRFAWYLQNYLLISGRAGGQMVLRWACWPMTIHIVCRFFLQYFKTKLIMFSQTNILKSGRACGQMVHRWAAHGRPLTICGRETVTLQFHFPNKLFFG